jgi:hypothetical protein
MSEARRIRIIVASILLVVTMIVGGLLAIPFMIRNPLPVVRPDAPVLFSDEEALPHLAAQLEVSPALSFEILVATTRLEEQEYVRLLLDMPGLELPATELELEPVGVGRFQATGRFHAPGRWRLRVVGDDRAHDFEFMLSEF